MGFVGAEATICSMTKAATEVQIRRASSQDALSVASVLRKAFAEYEPLYTKEGYEATTPGPHAVLTRMSQGPIWVAIHHDEIVGTASVVPKPEGIYVRGMAVLPAARGLGIGYLLLDEIQRFAEALHSKRLFLSTTPFLSRAISLYEAFGFARASEGPHDLFGTPLLTMQKILCLASRSAKRQEQFAATDRRRVRLSPCQ